MILVYSIVLRVTRGIGLITRWSLVQAQLAPLFFYSEISANARMPGLTPDMTPDTTGKTAAEIIYGRADSNKPFMGLTTWKNSPQGNILKNDVTIAKNYLNQEEVSKLNRVVNMFIDFAELRALNQQMMTMKDWLKQIEKFLNYTDQQILKHAGQISHSMALAKAEEEHEKYKIQRDNEYLSDFDRDLAKYLKGTNVQ